MKTTVATLSMCGFLLFGVQSSDAQITDWCKIERDQVVNGVEDTLSDPGVVFFKARNLVECIDRKVAARDCDSEFDDLEQAERELNEYLENYKGKGNYDDLHSKLAARNQTIEKFKQCIGA